MSHRFRLPGCAAMALLIGAVGCGPSQGPDSDAQEAPAVLRTALEAWKKGDAPESLQGLRPPIWFNEPEWKKSKLVGYQMDDKTSMYGRQVRCVVRLTLENGQGKRVEREVPYLVDTTPNRVIAREGH